MIQQAQIPMSAPIGGVTSFGSPCGDDLFARTQRIIQAAMAVQHQADNSRYSPNSLYALQARGNSYASPMHMNSCPAPTYEIKSVKPKCAPTTTVTKSKRKASDSSTEQRPQPQKKRAKKVKQVPAAPKKVTKTKVEKRKEPVGEHIHDDEEDKPKRPLSAYNLFFRHERAIVLMEPSSSESKSDEGSSEPTQPQTPEAKRAAVRKLLSNNPYHTDRKKRAHRKSHGKIGFTDLVKLIAGRWKGADADTRALFEELAEEDKKRYRRELKAWKLKDKQRRKSVEAVSTASEEVEKDEDAKTEQQHDQPSEKLEAMDVATMPALDMDDEQLFDFLPMPELGSSTQEGDDVFAALGNDLVDFLCEFD